MTNDTTTWANVWAAVRSRQEALRWTDAELCKRCEISPPIYRDGRNNGRPLSHPHKIAGLEDGLDWRRGSVESILAGGEPVVVERPTDSDELRPFDVMIDARVVQLEQDLADLGGSYETAVAVWREEHEALVAVVERLVQKEGGG